jgi:NadR type nicotinamide-nucleotide adenylyltransferase
MAPVPRVVVTGSECTGKTTLARDLAAHYDTVWVPEYIRGYLDAKGAPLVHADVERVARGQIEAESAARTRARGLLVQDTDVLSTVVYSRHYYGDCPGWVEEALLGAVPDLYLLLHPDVPWVPDPQRDRGHRREEMHALFRGAILGRGFPFVDVAGGWPERRARAVAAIDALLAGHPPHPPGAVVRTPEIP